ncbi:xanthine dehydrogenase family protein molybdopterin-binding subunit [Aurantimonas sp. VKM B-3413]|uniref:xanthine dehydrogenase family protein molybdopterin-binding subunit n=1 Tax=Aurantimonas sp. VKM B-3413 TaxID=2779401 RepID=UPI001E3C3E19|nr:xanthine dehydrogenase family protein molybdopterin-binding subunit [Aurantimonas sp. VKM B-3413]MCB8838307.1 xanthine dehydrogenase family protein molybdopterin-binding subunit [Aurantimonas sp. VKM B-3413]
MDDASQAAQGPASRQGVGASVERLEDGRYLAGRGRFVADIKLPGMLDIAFVRSPHAHARIRGFGKPDGCDDTVFAAADLAGVKGIRADSGLPGFRSSVQPILAAEKVRHVGEPIVACLATSRARAEDLAESVTVDFEELPAVSEMTRARSADAPLLHEHWDENVFLETAVDTGFEASIRKAAAVVKRTYRTARQCMAPMEGRGVVATWDNQAEQLVIYTSTQMPHIVRTGLCECLGLEHSRIRVIPPDVGGGFGYKGVLSSEEVFAAWAAYTLRRPVRWIEDRREHLTGGANCREHHYEITGYAAADGTLLAVDCEAIVDSGAYSIYPFSACLEAAQVASILPGPYRMAGYRCRTWSVATNKPPILPYRGVARTGVCFAMELTMDALAKELGIEPHEMRMKNLVRREDMPFTNITNKYFDSGDYPEALRRAVAAIDLPAIRARQRAGERIGVGFSIFCEQGAHGTSVYAGWGIPMVPGAEQAGARLTPDGGLELRVGVQSHGQSLETTLAQIAHEELGVPIDRVRLIHGDTALTPYSTGTWGSRCAVMAGGAVASATAKLAERVKTIAGHLLQIPAEDVVLADGFARAGSGQGEVSLAEIGRLWYLAPQHLPAGAEMAGLEVTEAYKPKRDSGTFSYACHAAVVSLDAETGGVELLDYVIVEDGGVLINPMVVDGQVFGGAAQGIGTALYEEMAFDPAGQPMAATFADYHLPGAAEIPKIRIEHMETPSPLTRFGQKGIGESGAIGPPAAIANAVNDALADLGVSVSSLPIKPETVLRALAARRKVAA